MNSGMSDIYILVCGGIGGIIAAAPDLYEALAALLNCVDKKAPFTTDSGMSIAMDVARKAIAKAGGEE